jgi:hypothetical protein
LPEGVLALLPKVRKTLARSDLDHLPAALNQVPEAGVMQRLFKAIEASPDFHCGQGG